MPVTVNIVLFQRSQQVYKDGDLYGEADILDLPKLLLDAGGEDAEIYIGGPHVYTEQLKARTESEALMLYGKKPQINLIGE